MKHATYTWGATAPRVLVLGNAPCQDMAEGPVVKALSGAKSWPYIVGPLLAMGFKLDECAFGNVIEPNKDAECDCYLQQRELLHDLRELQPRHIITLGKIAADVVRRHRKNFMPLIHPSVVLRHLMTEEAYFDDCAAAYATYALSVRNLQWRRPK